MVLLTTLSAARLTGPDAGAFLHSQLSADIQALLPGQSTFAAYCNPKGQVIGVLLVGRQGDDWIMLAAADLLQPMLQRLKMFVLRSRVDFHTMDPFAVAGLRVGEHPLRQSHLFAPLSSGLVYTLVEQTRLGADGRLLAQWRCDEIRSGICWLNATCSERFIPQMLGLDTIGAVSFSKGCYPGQEIVARSRYLGKVKRKPMVLEVAAAMDPADGQECALLTAAGKVPGTIVEHAALAADKTLLRVVTALEQDEPVQNIQVDGATWPARRVPVVR